MDNGNETITAQEANYLKSCEMEELQFKDGDEIEFIFFNTGESFNINGDSVDRITVVMENSEYCKVAWFAIWKDGKIKSKVNSRFVESVSFV